MTARVGQGLEYRVDNGVAVLSVTAAPGRFDATVRSEFLAALLGAETDEAVIGVVITGQGRGFPAGGPPDEILAAGALTAPDFSELCKAVAECSKPVVAAMRGTVRDGGFELALAAMARVAVTGTRVGLSEIAMGLIPDAGATQRLPRLIGSNHALEIIQTGQFYPVEAPVLRSLVTEIVPRNVVGAATRLARDLSAGGAVRQDMRPEPGLDDPIAFGAAIAARRNVPHLGPQARAAIDCVEAAQLLPLEVGLEFERTRRQDLLENSQVRGLLHIGIAERRAMAAAVGARPGHLTILGGGRAAQGLALAALHVGFRVELAEMAAGEAATLMRHISEGHHRSVERGMMDGNTARAQLARIAGGNAADILPRAEIVFEASGAPKSRMAEVIELLVKSTNDDVPVCLGSNMGLFAGDLAGSFGPRVVGAAIVQRLPGGRMVELVEPAGSDRAAAQAAAASVMAVFAAMGKTVVPVAAANGLIAQRLLGTLFAAAEWCVMQGASPWKVDEALGWPVGPFALMDREGLLTQPLRLLALGGIGKAGGLNQTLAGQGREGRGAGGGFHHYSGGGTRPERDPAAEAIIAAWRETSTGVAPDPASINRRINAALFSTGLALVQNGVAARASDIDLVAVQGLDLPRDQGGPMMAAVQMGLLTARRQLQDFSTDEPALWQSAPVLDEAIKNGGRFSD